MSPPAFPLACCTFNCFYSHPFIEQTRTATPSTPSGHNNHSASESFESVLNLLFFYLADFSASARLYSLFLCICPSFFLLFLFFQRKKKTLIPDDDERDSCLERAQKLVERKKIGRLTRFQRRGKDGGPKKRGKKKPKKDWVDKWVDKCCNDTKQAWVPHLMTLMVIYLLTIAATVVYYCWTLMVIYLLTIAATVVSTTVLYCWENWETVSFWFEFLEFPIYLGAVKMSFVIWFGGAEMISRWITVFTKMVLADYSTFLKGFFDLIQVCCFFDLIQVCCQVCRALDLERIWKFMMPWLCFGLFVYVLFKHLNPASNKKKKRKKKKATNATKDDPDPSESAAALVVDGGAACNLNDKSSCSLDKKSSGRIRWMPSIPWQFCWLLALFVFPTVCGAHQTGYPLLPQMRVNMSTDNINGNGNSNSNNNQMDIGQPDSYANKWPGGGGTKRKAGKTSSKNKVRVFEERSNKLNWRVYRILTHTLF